jgi:REP element-mobilizing transposase RayT
MREYETFCGVRVITFCLMANHFHLLVEVPQPPKELPSDQELLARLEALSGLAGEGTTRQMLERFRQHGHHQAAEEIRQRILSRMWDVSAFMKLLKQRFTQWFNRQRNRTGTLWEQRFKSVLVEGAGDVVATMAAYIDLNPVRAGLVNDPQDYRWSGYGEAMAGKRRAREGLRVVIAGTTRQSPDQVSCGQALAQYRQWLFGQGEVDFKPAPGEPEPAGFSREEVAAVIAQKGRVPVADYLRLRVRYFADGLVLGSRGFVNEIFVTFRDRFGPRRKDGARRMRGVDAPLYAMRDLRVRMFG